MRPYFETGILRVPETGRLNMPIELDFSAIASIDVDLEAELMDVGGIGFVQGIFIDNGARGDPLTLQFFSPANQGFTLRIPGKTQSWQPLLIPVGACRFTATSVALVGNLIELGLVNFPVQPIMWNTP